MREGMVLQSSICSPQNVQHAERLMHACVLSSQLAWCSRKPVQHTHANQHLFNSPDLVQQGDAKGHSRQPGQLSLQQAPHHLLICAHILQIEAL